MMRSYAFVLALVGALAASDRPLAATGSPIISEPAARRHGLTRPWFTQIQMDRARARITHVVLDAGTLFVQTDQAVMHAIDAETGQTLWAEQVGRRGHPSFAAAANEYLVAVVNGSYLYILNRESGKLLWTTQLEQAPGGAAAMSPRRVYVPTVNGQVLSYLLETLKDPLAELGLVREEEELSPEGEELSLEEIEEVAEAQRREAIRLSQEHVPTLVCQSYGRAVVQPLVTRSNEDEEYVAWPTDLGYLFVGHVVEREEHFTIRYKLETEAGIAARPTYSPPNPNIVPDSAVIYAASRDGFVHAVLEQEGSSLWRFSTAEPILERPVPIGESLYVITQPGGMYCLDAKTGMEKWWTHGMAQFVAASKDRLYVADKLGRILVLSAASGARLDAIPAHGLDIKLLNTQTDRIYVATATGLIQCLHEIELAEPILHLEPPQAPAPPAPAEEQPADQPAADQPAPSGVDPFSGQAAPKTPAGGDQGNPFGAPADDPFK